MNETHGWTLATFARRLAAYALDQVLFCLPLSVLVFTFIAAAFSQLETGYPGPSGEDGDSFSTQSFSYVLPGSLALVIGSGIWWLFALSRGQTPGKQLVGIRVIKDNGEPSNWLRTFLREFVIKGLAGGILLGMTGGIYWLADHLWPLIDINSQAIHDIVAGTLVVRG